MTSLREFLKPDDMREVHLRIFEDAVQEYLRQGPFGVESRAEVFQRIRNVKGKKLRRVIDAIPDFSRERIAENWAHWMALCAGTHVWPDANHRSGMATYNVATARAFNAFVSLDLDASVRMVQESKPIRRRFFEENERFYTVAELADPEHPYRQVYARYQQALVITDRGPGSGDG